MGVWGRQTRLREMKIEVAMSGRETEIAQPCGIRQRQRQNAHVS